MIGYYEQNTGSGRDFVRESFLSRSSTSLPTSASEANEKERFLWVNGAFNPSLNIRPGLTYRVRLINAAVDGVVNIHFARKVACDFVEIAADGVYYAFGRRRALDLALNSSILVAPVCLRLAGIIWLCLIPHELGVTQRRSLVVQR